jgi:hypothetical protein
MSENIEIRFKSLRDYCIKELQEMAFEEAKKGENPPTHGGYMLQQEHFRLLFIFNLLSAWFEMLPQLDEVLDKSKVSKP